MGQFLKKKAPDRSLKKKKHLRLVPPPQKEGRVKLKDTFWKSTLFNEIYLDQDIYQKEPARWDIDGNVDFEDCHNGLLNLFLNWKESQIEGWTEADTINHWIIPVLRALGWKDENGKSTDPYAEGTSFTVKNGDYSQTYIPDILISDTTELMGLYANRRLSGEKRLEKAKGKLLIPLEAKYWNRINKQHAGKLNKKEEKAKSNKPDAANSLGPNKQTLKYMEVLGLEWGILSDGATWRLFNQELSSESEGRYLEFNLYNLYKRSQRVHESEKDADIFREATKFFYNFFSKKALFPKDKKSELVRKALSESKSYADKVEDDLKDRFVSAINIVCNGLNRAAKSNGEKPDLITIRTVAEAHLFNILFIKSCEVRNILPLKADSYREISLSSMMDALHAFDPDDYEKSPTEMRKILDEAYHWFSFKEKGYELFDSLINLTKMIHSGSNGKGKGFYIEGFRESVFSKKDWKFATQSKLTNIEMVKALFELGFAKATKGSGRSYQEIPYKFFTPRQLGSIYESFLEYRIEKADVDRAYVKKEWKEANLKSEKVKKLKVPKVKKGDLFFTPDNKERKATGSYYTPQYIVDYIVKETIGPLCEGKSSKEILKLKVCDPAMGSGHFLNGALKLLTEKYIEALDQEVMDDITLTPEEAKRIVLDKCIFGVDINDRAVKLSKMSLWLESAHPGKKLERLKDQLVDGDSLAADNAWDSEFDAHWKGKFDAVIGNPPYIRREKFSTPKKVLEEEYKCFHPHADLYVYFIERIDFLLKRSGRGSYIVANKWMRTDYGRYLRNFLLDTGLHRIIDFRDLPVFKDVTTYPCIIFCTPSKSQDQTVDLFDVTTLEQFKNSQSEKKFIKHQVSKDDLSLDFWPIAPTEIYKVYKKIVANGVKFGKKYGKVTHSGVKTGLNPAFVLNREKANELIRQSNSSKEILRPFLEGKDVRKYERPNQNKFLIKFEKGWTKLKYGNLRESQALTRVKKDYPAVMNWLSDFEEKAKKRGDKGDFWWELRQCAYYDVFDRAKLIYPNICSGPEFTYDTKHYANQKTFVIAGKHFDLLAVLNSVIGELYFHIALPLLQGGFFEPSYVYMKQLPLPNQN